MTLSTHVLDTATGMPIPHVAVRLERHTDGGWSAIAAGRTGTDGRLTAMVDDTRWTPGRYRLSFDTSAFSPFFPEISVVFDVGAPPRHHHIPLLLSPFGYTTYRGS